VTPSWPLRPWLLIRESQQEQLASRLHDRRQPIDVAAAVAIVENVEQTTVDDRIHSFGPTVRGSGRVVGPARTTGTVCQRRHTLTPAVKSGKMASCAAPDADSPESDQ